MVDLKFPPFVFLRLGNIQRGDVSSKAGRANGRVGGFKDCGLCGLVK